MDTQHGRTVLPALTFPSAMNLDVAKSFPYVISFTTFSLSMFGHTLASDQCDRLLRWEEVPDWAY